MTSANLSFEFFEKKREPNGKHISEFSVESGGEEVHLASAVTFIQGASCPDGFGFAFRFSLVWLVW